MIPVLQEDELSEMEAMKSQFTALHKRQLGRQSSNQLLLRSPHEDCSPQGDDNEQKYTYGNVNIDNDKKHFPDYGDESTRVDEEDVAAMKTAFDKQQKLLLKTQIEKSFRLRMPGNTEHTDDNNNDNETHNGNADLGRLPSVQEELDGKDDNKDDGDDDEFNNSIDLSDIDAETEEKLVDDSEEMKTQFHELNKMMIRYRSTKTIEMGMSTPVIKPQHREQFNMLMNDIGIVNETIMHQLWTNIEKTVNDNNEEEEDDESDDVEDTNTLIQKLQEENEALRKQIKKQEVLT